MANETPDFLRARNATDIASQVSVPCQSLKTKQNKKVAVIVRTQFFPSIILLEQRPSIVKTISMLPKTNKSTDRSSWNT